MLPPDLRDDTYSIYYPSGMFQKVFARIFGYGPLEKSDIAHFVTIQVLENVAINGQYFQVGDAIILDPRCVILNSDYKLIYTPRLHMARMDDWAKQWLDENLSWPSRLDIKAPKE